MVQSTMVAVLPVVVVAVVVWVEVVDVPVRSAEVVAQAAHGSSTATAAPSQPRAVELGPSIVRGCVVMGRLTILDFIGRARDHDERVDARGG
jgi:hypothetical protein